jgi:hypothetical protein
MLITIRSDAASERGDLLCSLGLELGSRSDLKIRTNGDCRVRTVFRRIYFNSSNSFSPSPGARKRLDSTPCWRVYKSW